MRPLKLRLGVGFRFGDISRAREIAQAAQESIWLFYLRSLNLNA
jgi:hypothetical protein